tara:strand:+ start:68 stop:217 length:150 start_codon:yes stop_codon:yes gene_type:complete
VAVYAPNAVKTVITAERAEKLRLKQNQNLGYAQTVVKKVTINELVVSIR